jgi:hypothetical protein
MSRLPLWPLRGMKLLFFLSVPILLAGCITVECKDCAKCDTGGGEGCNWHYATTTDKTTYNCPSGGIVCSGSGTCAGTCTTTVSNNKCSCSCK